MYRKTLSAVFFTIAVFAGWLTLKTASVKSKQQHYPPAEKIAVPPEAVEHFAELLRLRTVSAPDGFDSAAFEALDSFLIKKYPEIHENLIITTFNKFSYLLEWPGADKALKPIVLSAYTDVPTMEKEDADLWKIPPFGGIVLHDTIYGRGARDDKASVAGMLEAVSLLLSEGFKPQRTIYIALGHDRLQGGRKGAGAMAAFMKNQGISPEFVLSEGGVISEGLIPAVLTEAALVGIAEKSRLVLKLTLKSETTQPALDSVKNILAQAVEKLRSYPWPPRITPPLAEFMDFACGEIRFQEKMYYANRRIFKSALLKNLPKPLIRNSLKNSHIFMDGPVPYAMVEYLLLPGEGPEGITTAIKNTIDNDAVEISVTDFHHDKGAMAETQGFGFQAIDRSIKEVFPYAVSLPFLSTTPTDGRHFSDICRNVYRFRPMMVSHENINRVYGSNEQISIDEYEGLIRFYVRLIKNSGGTP